jgi:hypothetical protein
LFWTFSEPGGRDRSVGGIFFFFFFEKLNAIEEQ